jgi:predicted oxidoreductase
MDYSASELADAGRRVIILDQEPESSLGGGEDQLTASRAVR